MMCLKAALDIRVSISPYGLFKIQAVKQQLKLYVQPLKPRPHGMGRACVQNGVGGLLWAQSGVWWQVRLRSPELLIIL